MIERIEINLLPAEYRIRKRSMNIPRPIVYSAVAFFVLSVGVGLYTIHLKDTESNLTIEIESISAEIAANKHIQADMKKLREEQQITDQKIMALERINVDREKWVRLLEILSGNLPTYTWLVSVKEEGAEKLVIEARTYSFPEVAQYMSKLEGTDYISTVDLTGIEQVPGDQGRQVYKFTIHCNLNRNVGIATAGRPGGGGE